MLEDGRLTDNKGRVIDFTNAMLILTSNVGSQKILRIAQGGGGRAGFPVAGAAPGSMYEEMRAAVKSEMSSRFRPELLNRLDEIVVFQALDQAEVGVVAELLLAQLKQRCEAEMDIAVKLTPALVEAVVQRGYSALYGARPLRRAVQAMCEDAVAEAVVDLFVSPGDTLTLDSDALGRVVLRNGAGKERVHVPAASGGGIEDGDAKGGGQTVAAAAVSGPSLAATELEPRSVA